MEGSQRGKKGYIDQVLLNIPGFRGYLAKEDRRESDRAQREHLAERLTRAKSHVGALNRRLGGSGLSGMKYLDRVSRVGDRLDRIISKVRYADRGYSGFFERGGIGTEELDLLHEIDAQSVEKASQVENALQALAGSSDPGGVGQAIDETMKVLDDFERGFERRNEILSGVA